VYRRAVLHALVPIAAAQEVHADPRVKAVAEASRAAQAVCGDAAFSVRVGEDGRAVPGREPLSECVVPIASAWVFPADLPAWQRAPRIFVSEGKVQVGTGPVVDGVPKSPDSVGTTG
jgi:hypothetical protein